MVHIGSSSVARLRVVRPGEGWSGDVGFGVGVIAKVEGADTGGALSITEVPFAIGGLVPPHIHGRGRRRPGRALGQAPE